MHVDPDAGIPDLIRRLSDDGRRLVADEIRLAKIETKENVKRAGRGGIRLALAFGVGVVALVGLWDPLESTCRHASLSIL